MRDADAIRSRRRQHRVAYAVNLTGALPVSELADTQRVLLEFTTVISPAMRLLTLVHSIISFFFVLVGLGLMVNIVSNFI